MRMHWQKIRKDKHEICIYAKYGGHGQHPQKPQNIQKMQNYYYQFECTKLVKTYLNKSNSIRIREN